MSASCIKCCKLHKQRRSVRDPKCGTIEIQNRGRVDVNSGENGGVYYLTPAGNKTYLKIPLQPKG